MSIYLSIFTFIYVSIYISYMSIYLFIYLSIIIYISWTLIVKWKQLFFNFRTSISYDIYLSIYMCISYYHDIFASFFPSLFLVMSYVTVVSVSSNSHVVIVTNISILSFFLVNMQLLMTWYYRRRDIFVVVLTSRKKS